MSPNIAYGWNLEPNVSGWIEDDVFGDYMLGTTNSTGVVAARMIGNYNKGRIVLH